MRQVRPAVGQPAEPLPAVPGEEHREPRVVVQELFARFNADDLPGVLALVGEDICWVNVPGTTVRGLAGFARVMRWCLGLGLGLGPGRGGAGPAAGAPAPHQPGHRRRGTACTVRTVRSDALGVGRWAVRFTVRGHLRVHEGRVVFWHDTFSLADLLVGALRGIAGVLDPQLNRSWPPPVR